MAGFGINDLKVAAPHEEAVLKQVISDAWVTMKRVNWDDTKFCTVNPSVVLSFSQAKSFFDQIYDFLGFPFYCTFLLLFFLNENDKISHKWQNGLFKKISRIKDTL